MTPVGEIIKTHPSSWTLPGYNMYVENLHILSINEFQEVAYE